MQPSDVEIMLNLQKFLMLFGFLVGLSIIVGAVALCFIAVQAAGIRGELLKLRVNSDMASDRGARNPFGKL